MNTFYEDFVLYAGLFFMIVYAFHAEIKLFKIENKLKEQNKKIKEIRKNFNIDVK